MTVDPRAASGFAAAEACVATASIPAAKNETNLVNMPVLPSSAIRRIAK
jgi:hypothetical protein